MAPTWLFALILCGSMLIWYLGYRFFLGYFSYCSGWDPLILAILWPISWVTIPIKWFVEQVIGNFFRLAAALGDWLEDKGSQL